MAVRRFRYGKLHDTARQRLRYDPMKQIALTLMYVLIVAILKTACQSASGFSEEKSRYGVTVHTPASDRSRQSRPIRGLARPRYLRAHVL